jgi:putative membrane protein
LAVLPKKTAEAKLSAFGRTIDVDRTKTGEDAIGTAIALGIEPPAQPEPEGQAEYRRLSTISSAAFDREFLRYIVKSHQADIRRFEAEANANDGNASAMARQQLPVLRRHLATAQAMQKARDHKSSQ